MSLRRHIQYWLAWVAVAVTGFLLLASVTLWIGSYWRGECFKRSRWSLSASTDEWWDDEILFGSGAVLWRSQHQTQPAFVGNFISADAPFGNNRTVPIGDEWKVRPLAVPLQLTVPGGRYGVNGWTLGSGRIVRIDLWLPSLAAVILICVAGAMLRNASRPFRRFGAGLCPSCGYDMRATPARCPECGMVLTR